MAGRRHSGRGFGEAAFRGLAGDGRRRRLPEPEKLLENVAIVGRSGGGSGGGGVLLRGRDGRTEFSGTRRRQGGRRVGDLRNVALRRQRDDVRQRNRRGGGGSALGLGDSGGRGRDGFEARELREIGLRRLHLGDEARVDDDLAEICGLSGWRGCRRQRRLRRHQPGRRRVTQMQQRPHAQRPRQGERYGARNELHQYRTKVPTPLNRKFVKCRLDPLHASPTLIPRDWNQIIGNMFSLH